MEFWAYPYLTLYLLMFFFWMLGTHRQILFWLYLWQLKEYHLGRFLAHFETAKGKSIFTNPLFLFKVGVLFFGYLYLFDSKIYLLPIVVILAVFLAQAAVSLMNILRGSLLRPEITKKSLLLMAASHVLLFGAAVIIFNTFLGEMSVPDFAVAAFWLLLLDVFISLIVSAVVLALQPITVWEKSKILKKADAIIANRPGLVVIGIAGSYGKSVTKELLAHILSQKYKVLKTQANQNTEIGVAQTIINGLKPEHQFFVCEIGAVHKGRIKQVCGIVKPKIGILTGINQQHMGVFGSQRNIIDGKFEILEELDGSGTAILNWGSKLVRENFGSQKNKIKTGNIVKVGEDIFADNIGADFDSLAFDVNYKNEKITLNTNARGAYMAEPILLALAGALAAGMDFREVAAILNKTDFNPFNIKTAKNSDGINILNSTYSSNPDGALAHLDYLKLWPGKKAVIMPCLIELGSASKDVHYAIGQKIAQVCDLAIITTKDNFNEIKKGALGAGMNPENIFFSENPAQVDNLIKNRLSNGDTVLFEGRIPKNLIELFSAVQ